MKQPQQKKFEPCFDELDSWLEVGIDGGCLACIDWLQVEQGETCLKDDDKRAV